MATLLHIMAHPTPEDSLTVRIANALIASYREAHPEDAVEVLDLYHDQPQHLTVAHMGAQYRGGNVEEMTPDERAAWDDYMRYVSQFKHADKYVVTAPMWNFGVPSVMKAYIDHIMLAGYTFQFTGPGMSVGLLKGKRMAIVSSRGGIYSIPPMSDYEMCVRYMHQVFAFLGITIVAEIVAEGVALVSSEEQIRVLEPCFERARVVGKEL